MKNSRSRGGLLSVGGAKGLWNILDLDAPGGVGLWKELLLVFLGTVVMLWTGTYFSNAGMESWDEDGPLSRLHAIQDTGNIGRRDKFSLYAKSLLAMAGSITYWDGVYTICEEHVWDNTWRYNLLCTVIGGVGLLWVMKGEESDDEDARAEKEHSRNDGDSTDAEDADGRHYDLSVRQEEGKAGNRQASESEAVASNSKFSMCRVKCVCGQGKKESLPPTGPAALEPVARAKLYSKGMFGNVCGVVLWKGVENLIVEESPDSDWTGLVAYAAGTVALLGVGSWMENCGLEEDDEKEVSRVAPTLGNASIRDEASSREMEDEDVFSGCWGLPDWISTAVELAAVIAVWTGVEWYIWEDYYILRPWYRDWCYIFGGLAVLLATGTFLNLAGTPLGGNARVKQEITPLIPPPLTTLGAATPSPPLRWSGGHGGGKRVQQECEIRASSSAPALLSARSNNSQQSTDVSQANRASTRDTSRALCKMEKPDPGRGSPGAS
eukprot:jgi/Undpi1/2818/HiC_scaffold_14.g06195.m1